MRIPLEDLSQEKLDKLKGMGDRRYVINSVEPCLTCGRHKRMLYAQRMDGKLFLIEECLYCLVRIRTFANRANQ